MVAGKDLRGAYVAPLDSVGNGDIATVGGKNASLGEMLSKLGKAGVPVPPGFAITTQAYRAFLAHNGIEEKIAAALRMDVVSIQRRVKMLDGICEEVVAQLTDRHCPMAVFDVLRKMKPLRQMAVSDLMVQHNNFSLAYASAILAGTPQADLVSGKKPKPKGVSPAAMAPAKMGTSGRRTTRTSWQKYLPPNWAPMPLLCVSLCTRS